MKPRSVGIVAGGGGPLGSASVLRDVLAECQRQYGSWRSYEYPCINFYSFPYSEVLLVHNNSSSIPSRELSFSIQQLKLIGMEIIVIPCFTMSSYLTYRNYGVELIEMGTVIQHYLEKNNLENPLILASERTRLAEYCDKFFACRYPNTLIQQELNFLLEAALQGKRVDLTPLLNKLPNVPIVCASTVLNAQSEETNDPRLLNANKILAQYIVTRSYEGELGNENLAHTESKERYIANCLSSH
jgi:hypothetical protein